MTPERAKVLLGAMQMFEHLVVSDSNDTLSIDSFCLVWNELAEIAYPVGEQEVSNAH